MSIQVIHGDCIAEMAKLIRNGVQVDSVVTDPPYHLTSIVKRFGGTSQGDDTNTSERARQRADGFARLSTGFMGKTWDGGNIAHRPETWRLCFDLLKPGGYLVAFGGCRTYHRMACAIEDAGFIIHPLLGWVFGQGFPKAHDLSKAIDKAAGVERETVGVTRGGIKPGGGFGPDGTLGLNEQEKMHPVTTAATDAAKQWDGWYYGGQALKPAIEPICMAQKPPDRKMVENVLEHGTGAINVDGCRVAMEPGVHLDGGFVSTKSEGWDRPWKHDDAAVEACRERGKAAVAKAEQLGRWPANVIHDGSDEVMQAFAAFGESKSTQGKPRGADSGDGWGMTATGAEYVDTGTAARFFYCAKADKSDRLGSRHPTIKPVDLMAWLVRLITPPGGLILDPFAGSGTTAMACLRESFDAILIEKEADSVADIRHRLDHVSGLDTPLFAAQPEVNE